MVLHPLGMLEGQKEELAQRRLDLRIKAGVGQLAGVIAGQGVSREHVRRATKSVARELVQQNQQRQGTVRSLEPAFELASCSSQVHVQKTLAKLAVKLRILGKPAFTARRLPEINYGAVIRGRRLHICHRVFSRTGLPGYPVAGSEDLPAVTDLIRSGGKLQYG